MHKVIDKALIARNTLISGMSLPQATASNEINRQAQDKVDRLTQYINDLMFEFRIRKEMTGDTALAIMNNSLAAGSASTSVIGGTRSETAPFFDGAVR